MNNRNKLNTIFIVLAAAALVLACGGGGDQLAEANKRVDEANKKIDEVNDLIKKTEAQNQILFGANIQTVGQLNYYKDRMRSTAKDIVDSYEKAGVTLKEVAKIFDDASRLNVSDKYKEYVKLKSDEFGKRAEAADIRKGNAQAFIEIDSPRTMAQKFNDNNDKFAKKVKEADDIAEKAKKIEADNKDIFKTT